MEERRIRRDAKTLREGENGEAQAARAAARLHTQTRANLDAASTRYFGGSADAAAESRYHAALDAEKNADHASRVADASAGRARADATARSTQNTYARAESSEEA